MVVVRRKAACVLGRDRLMISEQNRRLPIGSENCCDHTMPFLASNRFNKLCYREWGGPRNRRVLSCVHGLSRNRLDFDQIAEKLSDYYRVIAVDMPGRGGSERSPQ